MSTVIIKSITNVSNGPSTKDEYRVLVKEDPFKCTFGDKAGGTSSTQPEYLVTPPAGLFGKCSVVATVNGTASAPFEFTVPPYIIAVSISPDAVYTITGDHFGETGSVSLDSKSTSVLSWSNTKITGVVPIDLGRMFGRLKVTAYGVMSEKEVTIPRLMTLAAKTGKAGTTLEIRSNSFDSKLASNEVRICGKIATIAWVNPNDSSRIVATIPSTLGTCSVSLTGESQGVRFSLTTPLMITEGLAGLTALSKTSAAPGSSLTLSGCAFGPAPAGGSTDGVRIGGKPATSTSWSDTEIIVTVPEGADDTGVVVIRDGLASNTMPFSIACSVSAIEPTHAAPGATVTVSGEWFGAVQGRVVFSSRNGTIDAPIQSWSERKIVVTVPEGVRNGAVRVFRGELVSTKTVEFTTPWAVYSIPSELCRKPEGKQTFSQRYAIRGNFNPPFRKNAIVKLYGLKVPFQDGGDLITINAPSWPEGHQQSAHSPLTVDDVVVRTVSTPVVIGVNPLTGPHYRTVSISGFNFGATQGTSTVKIGGKSAEVSKWSDTLICAEMKEGGRVSVTVQGVTVMGDQDLRTL